METFLTDLQPGICSQYFGQSQPQLSYQKGSNIKKTVHYTQITNSEYNRIIFIKGFSNSLIQMHSTLACGE